MKKLLWGVFGAIGALTTAFGAYKLFEKKKMRRLRGVVSDINQAQGTFCVRAPDGDGSNPKTRFKITPYTTFSWLAVFDSAKNTASRNDLDDNAEVLVVYCPCFSEPYAAHHVVLEKVR